MKRLVVLLMLLVALSGCAPTGPKKRIFPPQARLQQVQLDEQGRWQLALRVHNFSNVPMRFSRIDATLSIDTIEAGQIVIENPIDVSANSVEVVQFTLTADSAAQAALQRGLAGDGIAYTLNGRITGAEPRGKYPFEFSSRLDRVPGLQGVLR